MLYVCIWWYFPKCVRVYLVRSRVGGGGGGVGTEVSSIFWPPPRRSLAVGSTHTQYIFFSIFSLFFSARPRWHFEGEGYDILSYTIIYYYILLQQYCTAADFSSYYAYLYYLRSIYFPWPLTTVRMSEADGIIMVFTSYILLLLWKQYNAFKFSQFMSCVCCALAEQYVLFNFDRRVASFLFFYNSTRIIKKHGCTLRQIWDATYNTTYRYYTGKTTYLLT